MTTENVDRGDDFTPSTDAADAAAAAAAAAAQSEAEAEAAKVAAKADEEGDKPAAKTDEEGDKPAARADDKPRDDKGKFIPKGRFDEAVSKERSRAEAAERQLAELQKQLQSNVTAKNLDAIEQEITTMEGERAKALLDGNAERVAQLDREIRLKERTVQLTQAENMTVAAREQAAEQIRMDTAINALETAYDVLNPKHESFDQGIVDMVLDAQEGIMKREKMPPSQALAEAAKRVMGRIMPVAREEEGEAKQGLAAGKGADVAKDRQTKAVERNVDAARRQAPDTKDIGLDSDKAGGTRVDPTNLSYEEFSALPESTKARMRGDTL